MTMHKNVLKFTEILLISFVWLVLIAAPILLREDEINFEWISIMKPMKTIIPLFFIFLVNRFVLVPLLLFKKRRFLYVISVAAMITVLTIGSYFYHVNFVQRQSLPRREMDNRRRPEPQNPPSERPGFNRTPPPEPPLNTRPMPPYVNLLIFSLLMVGFDTGLKASFRWAETEKEKAKLEKENVVNQLDMLRNQVSPHFFMNTLNNIHALIDIDKDQAKGSVIKLSKLMRYLLTESQRRMASLKDEFEFLNSYIDLIRLRCSDRVKISVNLEVDESNIQIPSLLFISLLENAFKFGVSYSTPSFISIEAKVIDDHLHFEVINSKALEHSFDLGTGVGLVNLRKQLDLIYGANYSFDIMENENEFKAHLKIPISHD